MATKRNETSRTKAKSKPKSETPRTKERKPMMTSDPKEPEQPPDPPELPSEPPPDPVVDPELPPEQPPKEAEMADNNYDPTVVGGRQPIYCPQCKEEVKAQDSYHLSLDNQRYHYPVCWQKHELGIG